MGEGADIDRCMRTAAFIIHLHRATARRSQVDRLISLLPVPTAVLNAIDGQSMTDEEYGLVARRRMHSPPYPFELSKAETACFLSHRQSWQEIVDGGLDAGLVLEDDVDIVSPSFAAVIESALHGMQPDEFIRFPVKEKGEAGVIVRERSGTRVIEPRLPGRGMYVQAIGAEAARRLLEVSRAFDRPVDSFVQMQWLHGARVLSARPIVVRHVDFLLGGTVLHQKPFGLREWAKREWQRPLMRLAVLNANEHWRRRAA